MDAPGYNGPPGARSSDPDWDEDELDHICPTCGCHVERQRRRAKAEFDDAITKFDRANEKIERLLQEYKDIKKT